MKKPLIITQNKYDACDNIYHEVRIGHQIWMVENWKCPTKTDGGTIELITDATAWVANEWTAKYCYPNGDINNVAQYGLLFSQYCRTELLIPDGWRISTQSDYIQLRNYLGTDAEAYTALWPGGSSGFEAQPAGIRGGTFESFGSKFKAWNEINTNYYYAELFSGLMHVDSPLPYYPSQTSGLTIRLIKN